VNTADVQPARFSGFADLYDSSRPAPPPQLGALLVSYASKRGPRVVDLGSGTGLSSRWAATWAAQVTGIEPNDDMRTVAESRPTPGVTYSSGWSYRTGLEDGCADIVMAVQAMHWMEPETTLAEVARLLRPGGVFAVIDADWPPVAGLARAEQAWESVHRRTRALEGLAAAGAGEAELRRAIREMGDNDPALGDDDIADPRRDRAIPGGAQSWAKAHHLERLRNCGHFSFVRELLFDQEEDGGPERFVALFSSQGGYQTFRRLGLTDDDLGMDHFRHEVEAAYREAATFARGGPRDRLCFSWRARLGVTAE
jgi:SAM-dependent methyltransferase